MVCRICGKPVKRTRQIASHWVRHRKQKRYQERIKELKLSDKLKRILKNLPTSFEKKIIDLCEKYNLPFRYIGNGEVIIGFRNPDFIECNGKKLIIETYCSFYHPEDYEEKRGKLFAKYGYRTLFLNENDLCDDSWESICLNKIKNFLNSN